MSSRPICLAVLFFALSLLPTPAAAKDPVFTGLFGSLAVSGYDAVAYFAAGEPVEGSADHEFEWNGATWRFASAANLAAFQADPAAYAPQYGGYCAWAVAQGATASSDPIAWRIVGGKLYLNNSPDIHRRWQKDIAGNIAKGDTNWPQVLD